MNSEEQRLDDWWMSTFLGLVNKSDFEKLIEECFTDNAIVMPPNSNSIVGKPAVLAWFKELFEPLKGLKLNIERDSVDCTVINDYAIHIEEGRFVALSGDGEMRLFEMPRKYMHIFHRESGAWKLDKYIWNEGVKEVA